MTTFHKTVTPRWTSSNVVDLHITYDRICLESNVDCREPLPAVLCSATQLYLLFSAQQLNSTCCSLLSNPLLNSTCCSLLSISTLPAVLCSATQLYLLFSAQQPTAQFCPLNVAILLCSLGNSVWSSLLGAGHLLASSTSYHRYINVEFFHSRSSSMLYCVADGFDIEISFVSISLNRCHFGVLIR